MSAGATTLVGVATDWIELEGVGHAPQLDVPLEAAHLITDFTTRC